MMGVAQTYALHPVDGVILVAYLIGIVGLGSWVGLRRKRGESESRDYFLAGGTLTWPVIGLALFSTNISTIHLVSFAQEGYLNGLAYGNFEWMAPFTLIVTALFFAPFYIRTRVATLPDFLEMRYNRACRDWLAILSIVSAVFIHIGFSLYTGAVVMRGMFGFPIELSITAIALMVGVYTVLGGLRSVVLTESIEAVMLLLGAVIMTAIAYFKVGGIGGLQDTLAAHGETTRLSMLRSADDASGLPWYAVFLGYPVIGIWYWCADQTIVQRVLGAKDENHARVGALFAGYIKIFPVFLFIFPGLMMYALVLQGQVPAELEDSKNAYAFMIDQLLPVGLKGLVTASLLAALMGTVSGSLNSIATLVSYDLVKRWRPATGDRKLVFIGRVTTVIAMVAAILWSPLLDRLQSIFQGIVALISYVAPPITAVFLFGVFWKRASGIAAQATLYVGSFLGLVVFLLDQGPMLFGVPDFGWEVPSLLASFYLCIICMALLAALSIWRPANHTETSIRLVWPHPLDAMRSPGWKGIGNYKLLAAVLFLLMVALYALFA